MVTPCSNQARCFASQIHRGIGKASSNSLEKITPRTPSATGRSRSRQRTLPVKSAASLLFGPAEGRRLENAVLQRFEHIGPVSRNHARISSARRPHGLRLRRSGTGRCAGSGPARHAIGELEGNNWPKRLPNGDARIKIATLPDSVPFCFIKSKTGTIEGQLHEPGERNGPAAAISALIFRRHFSMLLAGWREFGYQSHSVSQTRTLYGQDRRLLQSDVRTKSIRPASVFGQQPHAPHQRRAAPVDHAPLESDNLKAMLYEIAPNSKSKQFEETGDVDSATRSRMSPASAPTSSTRRRCGAVFRQIPSRCFRSRTSKNLTPPCPPS